MEYDNASFDLGFSAPAPAEVREPLRRAAETSATGKAAISQALVAPIRRAQAVAESATSTIQGKHELALVKADQAVEAAHDKIVDSLIDKMGRAYAYAAPLGIEIPRREDLPGLAGVDTGHGLRVPPSGVADRGGDPIGPPDTSSEDTSGWRVGRELTGVCHCYPPGVSLPPTVSLVSRHPDQAACIEAAGSCQFGIPVTSAAPPTIQPAPIRSVPPPQDEGYVLARRLKDPLTACECFVGSEPPDRYWEVLGHYPSAEECMRARFQCGAATAYQGIGSEPQISPAFGGSSGNLPGKADGSFTTATGPPGPISPPSPPSGDSGASQGNSTNPIGAPLPSQDGQDGPSDCITTPAAKAKVRDATGFPGLQVLWGGNWSRRKRPDGTWEMIVPLSKPEDGSFILRLPPGILPPYQPVSFRWSRINWMGAVGVPWRDDTGKLWNQPVLYQCGDTSDTSGAGHPCSFQMPETCAVADCMRVEICNWPEALGKPSNGKPPQKIDCSDPKNKDRPECKEQPKPGEVKKIPDIGNTDWSQCPENPCEHFEQLAVGIKDLASWGTALLKGDVNFGVKSLIKEVLGLLGFPDFLISAITTLLPADAVISIFGGLVGSVGTLLTNLVGVNVEIVIGCMVARTVLHALESLKIGFQFGPVILVDINFRSKQAHIILDQLENWALPIELPGENAIVEGFRRDLYTREQAICLFKQRGLDPCYANKILDSSKEFLTSQEIIEYGRRTDQGDDWINDELRKRGWVDPERRDQVRYLYDEVPTIQDLLHFARTNALNKDAITRLGLDQEFQDRFYDLMKKELDANGVSEDYAKWHWQAHWIRASVEQAQQALRRLRPGRVDDRLVFTEEDFTIVMQENDVVPFWRERFKQLGYQPPTIRFIRELYLHDVWKKEDVLEGLQDISYSLKDATALADSLEITNIRTLASQAHGYSIGNLIKAYQANDIEEDFLRTELQRQKYTDEQIEQAVAIAQQELRAKLRKQGIDVIHKSYLRGGIERNEAQSLLAEAGVDQVKITNMLNLWVNERYANRHNATRSELIGWAKEGLISEGEFRQRLERIGYEQSDADRIISGIAQQLAELATKKAESEARREKAAEDKAASAERRAAEAAQKRELAAREKIARAVITRAKKAARATYILAKTMKQVALADDIAKASSKDEKRALRAAFAEWDAEWKARLAAM